MISSELRQHLAAIGAKGGARFKPGSKAMRDLASLSWSPQARAKRLRLKHAKAREQSKINKINVSRSGFA